MDTLISVLLYLNVVTSTGTYTSQEINDYATVFATQISQAENTPGELPIILNEYEPLAIIVIDGMEG